MPDCVTSDEQAGGRYMAEYADDAAMMADMARGNADAFDRLTDRYGDSVYAFAFRLCGEKAMTDDIVQDVFLKVCANTRVLSTVVLKKYPLISVCQTNFQVKIQLMTVFLPLFYTNWDPL